MFVIKYIFHYVSGHKYTCLEDKIEYLPWVISYNERVMRNEIISHSIYLV